MLRFLSGPVRALSHYLFDAGDKQIEVATNMSSLIERDPS